jgi:hypothetical protein
MNKESKGSSIKRDFIMTRCRSPRTSPLMRLSCGRIDSNKSRAALVRCPASVNLEIYRRRAADNRATGGIRMPHRRLKEIVDVLTAKAAEFRSEALRSPRRKFGELREAARAAGMDASRASCDCGWGQIYARRFGLACFPCLHTVLCKLNFM